MYTVAHIAQILSLRTVVTDERLIRHILIDSRKLLFPEQTIFFALKGPRNDGHQFIDELYQRGVRAFVVSELADKASYPEAVFLEVQDPLQSMQKLVAAHRKQFDIPVIGITGSNGKTIVKEWLYQLLSPDYSIVRSPKSYNSQIGVPLSVWQMESEHQLGIFEAGISQAGEMDRLQSIILPTMGVFTNIGEAHSEGFLNIRQKVNEKLKLFTGVDVLIYSKDDVDVHENAVALWRQLKQGDKAPFTLLCWSHVGEADLQVLHCLVEDGITTITAQWNNETRQIEIPFTDAASIENALHCWCVLLYMHVPQQQIADRMRRLSSVAMRLELKQGVHQCSVINDSYSSDINSLKIALDFMVQQGREKHRTLILSDMLQSGRPEAELYTSIVELIRQRGMHRFIGIGPRLMAYQHLFHAIESLQTAFYESTAAFLNDFKHLQFRDETVLLKGARLFEFERIGKLLELQQHQTVMEINLNSLIHNLKAYQTKLLPGTRIMAMVKAFAYGSGGYEIARVLEYHKVDYLAVAYVDEGISLRQAGIRLPIMVMNPEVGTYDALVQYALEPVLFSCLSIQTLHDHLKTQGVGTFPIHLELETGMNRLGLTEGDLSKMLPVLQEPIFKVQSVFTHLVASEDPTADTFTQKQFQQYQNMATQLSKALRYPFYKHISNTSGISRHPGVQLDMVRLGIGLYGIDSAMEGLKEVSTLRSTIAQIKKLDRNETVGYGRKGTLKRDSVIATVRIGYADGYPRSLSEGKGNMLVRGVLAPVIGNICMDMTMIDITDIPGVAEGDPVILFGADLPCTTLATWAGTIPYEILTGVSQRVKRVYFEE